MLKALMKDPMVIKGARVATIYGLVDLMDTALEAAPRLQMPFPLLYGAHDEIVPQGVSDIPNVAGSMRLAPSHIRICVMGEASPSPSRGISTMCMRDLRRSAEPSPQNYCPSVSFS